jgi:hypothetical protein
MRTAPILLALTVALRAQANAAAPQPARAERSPLSTFFLAPDRVGWRSPLETQNADSLLKSHAGQAVLLDLGRELHGYVELSQVRAVLQIRDIPYTGSFRCHDERLNRFWQVGSYCYPGFRHSLCHG